MKQSHPHFFLILFVVQFSCSAFQVRAATLYLEEQLFLDGLNGVPRLESFEISGGSSGLREFDFGEVRVSNPGVFRPRWAIRDEQRSLFPQDGDFYLSYPGSQGDTVLFDFDFPITAFGIYLFDYGSATRDPLDFVPNVGETLSWFPDFQEGEQFLQFVGYVSDTPFTSLGLLQNDDQSYLLDSLYFLPVPEPSSALLLASALPVLLNRKRTCRP